MGTHSSHLRRGLVALTLALGMPLVQGSAAFLPPQVGPARASVAWLQTQESTTGLIGDPGNTEDAVLSAAASGINPGSLVNGGVSAVSYLVTNRSAIVYDCASAGKLALALIAARQTVTPELTFLAHNFDAATGIFCSGSTWDQAFSILALRSAPATAVARLLQLQLSDGSWNYCGPASCYPYGGDTNSTAVALQALAAAGVTLAEPHVALGYLYLRSAQAPSGGFAYCLNPDPNSYCTPGVSDPNSDAIVVEAISAFGDDACSPLWTRAGGSPAHNPINDLLAAKQPDGSFVAPGGYALYSTSPAGVALMGANYEVSPAAASAPVDRIPATPALAGCR